VVLGRNSEKGKTLISHFKNGVSFYQVDVSDYDACKEIFRKIKKNDGLPLVLINNAGVIGRDGKPGELLIQMSPEEWDYVLKVNLYGTFNCTKAVIMDMVRKKFGRIINMTSISGIIGNAGQIAYSASKAGIIGFTKAVAKEYAKDGIICNAVAPGVVETTMLDTTPNDVVDNLVKSTPMGRKGKPEEVAKLVLYIIESTFETGHVYNLSGGLYM
jgi:3-oxoacyl-[acyl-carrier protein] reductase